MSYTVARAGASVGISSPQVVPKQSVICNPADRTQIALAIFGPVVVAFPFFVSFDLWFEILLWFVVWFSLCRHNYILHNHVHRPFTRSKVSNRILGTMLGFCTGMTVGIWKITHVHGHHVEHKIESLPSRAYVRRLGVDAAVPFSARTATAHALKTAPIQFFLPLYIMTLASFTGAPFRRTFYRFYLLEFLLVYGLVGVFAWVNPVKAFYYFGVIYSLVYLASRYVDFVTHASSSGKSEYSIANVCIHPRFNNAFWNFGFHVAHHVQPTAHWTALPSIHEKLAIVEDPTAVAKRPNILGLFSPRVFIWRRIQSDAGGC